MNPLYDVFLKECFCGARYHFWILTELASTEEGQIIKTNKSIIIHQLQDQSVCWAKANTSSYLVYLEGFIDLIASILHHTPRL